MKVGMIESCSSVLLGLVTYGADFCLVSNSVCLKFANVLPVFMKCFLRISQLLYSLTWKLAANVMMY